tara:strand:+ start:45 stop:263 length:219 start_codon:yes stop_codon:yes gene_type:complete
VSTPKQIANIVGLVGQLVQVDNFANQVFAHVLQANSSVAEIVSIHKQIANIVGFVGQLVQADNSVTVVAAAV